MDVIFFLNVLYIIKMYPLFTKKVHPETIIGIYKI